MRKNDYENNNTNHVKYQQNKVLSIVLQGINYFHFFLGLLVLQTKFPTKALEIYNSKTKCPHYL